ncbi:hypothetical protein EV426DRAFT_618886 [Tirmania nivea]|nr:hypothetical protein EV426DRAFT_618886 [Tirmania nivea]
MGQYWEMVAHERCETLGNWGKAGEFVDSVSPAQIIHRLVVPVAIDVSDVLGSSNNGHRGDAGSGYAAAHQSSQDGARLLQLPLEVVFLITNQLDLNSLYTLTHCCRLLRSVLHGEVHSRFRSTLAPWANTPLMCAGDYIRSNPPSITTQVPKDFIPDPRVERDIPSSKYLPMTAYHLMLHMHPTNVVTSLATCLSPPTLNPIPLSRPSPWYRRRQINLPWQRILKIKKYFPPGRNWVLRNLTTLEYVYVHVLTSKDGYGGGLDSPDAAHEWGFTIGTLVAVRTCWSDDSSAGMSGLEVRGRWAGDCFDIVEEERLLRDMKTGDGVWVDVSHSEWEAMVQLYEQNRWNGSDGY